MRIKERVIADGRAVTDDLSAVTHGRLNVPEMLGWVPLFHGFPTELLRRIAAMTELRKLEKGEQLFQMGDMPTSFFIIAFGQVKEAIRSSRGDEKIIEIIGPRQSFGETAMFLDRPYPFFVESLQDTLLLCIAKEMIFDLLETSSAFAKGVVARLSMRLHSLVNDIESYTLRSPEQRFVGYLIQRCTQEERGEINLSVALPATKLAIASRLDMTPQTFSRILGAFSDAGLISVHGKYLSIPDLKRLEQFAH